MAKPQPSLMDKIVSLCKRKGFVFQASEIYGGIGNTYDYGPLGVELLRRVREAWWNRTVVERSDVVGLDSAIIQNPKVWETSGHVGGFSDPMVDCKKCKARFREDQIQDSRCPEKPSKRPAETLAKRFRAASSLAISPSALPPPIGYRLGLSRPGTWIAKSQLFLLSSRAA